MEDQNKQSAASLFSQPTPDPVGTSTTPPTGQPMPDSAAPAPAPSPFSPAYPPEVSAMPVTPVPQPSAPPSLAPTMAAAPEPAFTPTPVAAPSSDSVVNAPSGAPVVDGALLDIKQQALQELSPLVEHLEQSAEEKFKTTMMMLQATDNQALVQQAYDAANAIEDKKVRAQALLDVVNEINYFTHQHQQEQSPEEQISS